MKKLAFVCELVGTIRQGGENIAMLRMAESLRNSQFNVDVYTYANKNPYLRIESAIPLKLRLVPFVREMIFVPFIGMYLLKRLEKQYDAIFASSMTIASFIKPKKPLIVVCHLIRSQKFEKLSKIPKYKLLFNPITYFIMSALEKKSLQNTKKIIVIRKQQKDYLVDKLGINKEKIYVIPNGINTSFFKPKKIAPKNQIIFVGRGTTPKGIDTLLDAAYKINATIIIATTKIDKQFTDIAKKIKNVVIKYSAGPEEMRDLYQSSKVFVLPSLNEEQPLSTIEAMACGLPIVVTQEAASDIALNEINGFIIPEHSPKELSDKVNTLLKNDKLRRKIGLINRKRILENYDQKKAISQTIKLLYDI